MEHWYSLVDRFWLALLFYYLGWCTQDRSLCVSFRSVNFDKFLFGAQGIVKSLYLHFTITNFIFLLYFRSSTCFAIEQFESCYWIYNLAKNDVHKLCIFIGSVVLARLSNNLVGFILNLTRSKKVHWKRSCSRISSDGLLMETTCSRISSSEGFKWKPPVLAYHQMIFKWKPPFNNWIFLNTKNWIFYKKSTCINKLRIILFFIKLYHMHFRSVVFFYWTCFCLFVVVVVVSFNIYFYCFFGRKLLFVIFVFVIKMVSMGKYILPEE